MASGGAPTGQWETLPEHLKDEAGELDIAALSPKLRVRRPGVPEVEIPIDKKEFIIGRLADEVDLVLDDEWVSKKHAKLTMNARGYFRLEDMGSQNKIQFQGRAVRRLNVVDGDEFSIGKTDFTFHAKMPRFNSATAPPPQAPVPEEEEEPEIPDPAEHRSASMAGDLEPPPGS